MSKKMKLPWQWPSCKNPKTLSFRATKNDDVFKTINSVFLETFDGVETPESWFTNSSECASTFSGADDHSDDYNNANSSLETIIRGVRLSERLFFEPGDTSSILKESKTGENNVVNSLLPFKESVALALESEDPYLDFKKSMQEMVESHGIKDWEGLEELLGWYLKINGKKNHGFIVGAFVDMLVDFTPPPAAPEAALTADESSYSSADSCFSCPSPVSPAGV